MELIFASRFVLNELYLSAIYQEVFETTNSTVIYLVYMTRIIIRLCQNAVIISANVHDVTFFDSQNDKPINLQDI